MYSEPVLTDPRPTTRPPAALIAARVLFGAFGALKLAGTVYFSFIASAAEGGDPHGVGDWLVVAWSFTLALSFLALAARLGTGDRRLVRVATGLLVADLAFSTVKLTVYDEQTAVGFMAVTALLLALLGLAVRADRRRTAVTRAG